MRNKKFFGKSILSLILTAVVLLSCVSGFSVLADESTEIQWKTAKELIEERGFLNGIQMMETRSGSTGNDIGKAGFWGDAADFRPEAWKEFFANSKAMGYDICKFWCCYQMGGIVFDSEYLVVGYSSTYLTNLETIFQLAQEQGIYICLTLMNHFESMGGNVFSTNYRYNKILRFVYNDTYRNAFINNWVKPVLECSARYPNVIMADLYCEPEADGGLWNTGKGTNWENMRTFIMKLQEAVEKYNPRLATYSSSSTPPITNQMGKRFQGLGLDFYAYDQYNASGATINPEDALLDRPYILGEVGPQGVSNTYSALTAYYNNYLNSCVQNNVKAAFFWKYQPGVISSSGALLDANGRLREETIAIRTWASDYEHALKNTTHDKAAMMYSTPNIVRWFAARGAESMVLQKSNDKTNWTDVVTINSSNAALYRVAEGSMRYEYNNSADLTQGETAYYRVVSSFSDGAQTVSDISCRVTK